MQSADTPYQAPNPQFREYLAVLRLRRWSIIAITLIAIGSALAFSLRQTPTYQSSARVLVKPISLSPTDPGAVLPANLETERGLAASVPVARRVAEELDLAEEPQALLEDLSVEVVSNSEFLVVTYQHPDPIEAQRRTQAFAQSYLDFRRDQAVSDVLAAGQSVQRRIQNAREQLAELDEEIQGATPSEELALEGERDVLVSQLAVLQQQLSELTPSNLSVGQVVEPATLASDPSSPNYLLNLGLAALLGLGLGIALAFLRERLDDRLRGRADMEAQAGAPVLAVIPRVGSWRKRKDAPVITITEPKSAASEAYRTLRTALTFLANEHGYKVFLVTSPHPEEGKSATVSNLAVSFAEAGRRALAISADLRKPRLHRFLRAGSNGKGLTNVLAGEVGGLEALAHPGVQSLRLLHSGPVPGNPSELLGSERMGELLDEFRQISDFVLIDTAPVLAVADALALAPFADAVILVADAETTTRGAISHARYQLDQVNANVVGAVLNNFDPSKAGAYPYYQYQYVYRYEEPGKGRLPWRRSKPAGVRGRGV
jgi:non-specific protein-tyrosine kinase